MKSTAFVHRLNCLLQCGAKFNYFGVIPSFCLVFHLGDGGARTGA